ncbi:MAG: hydrogenase [Verrucomicrobiales bacterium]|nr:hydrogenase [Verrucomicrobiales bacterium]
MKTIPPLCPEPESGIRYWRSMDDLADSPEFHQWVEREFPAGASELKDPVSRRHFVKIMSASFLLAGIGITGCRRPEERILPFGKQPENYIHGVPQFYATAMPTRLSAIPLLVRSSDGRPTKIEGNPEHPVHDTQNSKDPRFRHGGTDTFAQASILNLYDPDRAQRFAQGGNTATKAAALDALANISRQTPSGQGLAFLLEQSSSPSRARLQAAIAQKFPQAKWYQYEPVDLAKDAAVLSDIAGTPVAPFYRLDQAKVILSLDSDFVGSEEDTYRHCRGFSWGRKVAKPGDAMNRLYSVESMMTLTGANADHRLRVPASAILPVAAAIATQIAPDNAAVSGLARKFPLPQGVDPKWIAECAADLAANKGATLVMAGYRQPAAVHVLAHLINAALGNVGKTVQFVEGNRSFGSIAELGASMKQGQVNTLVILGGNPVYNAPADVDFKALRQNVKTIVRLGYYEDETFAISDLHIPAAHYLESWGDARTSDNTLVPIQPLIAPLFAGLTDLEVLARIGGLEVTRPHDIVRETFSKLSGGDLLEEKWKKFLHDGYLEGSGAKFITPNIATDKATALLNNAQALPAPSKDKIEVVLARDYKMDDGRFNNNGWLQELPDPITKTVWDGVVQMSRATAEAFNVKNEDVVEISVDGNSVQAPVWVTPGIAEFSVVLSFGYGRRKTGASGGSGRVGDGVGIYNAYRLRTSNVDFIASGAALKKTGQTYKVSCTQEHGSMSGRPIVREANWQQYKEHPGFAKNMDLEAHTGHLVLVDPTPEQAQVYGTNKLPQMIYEHPYRGVEKRNGQSGVSLGPIVLDSKIHQWGMTIDLTTCVGCNACVLACQSENNVPIVGKDQVSRNREMHWLRIDRYFSGLMDKPAKDQVDNPQVVNQPMLCQHCENAPCESVCPVNATVHDEEGLNIMAYNRCVGTRYCSNNCPYKVRRFNFFDYNKHLLKDLYKSPLVSGTDGEWNLIRWAKDPYTYHTKPEDEWQLLKLAKNPDVSVRERGVMEKCTFCVQRIEGAKISQKVKAGQSGNVQVPDGGVKTACQQACPAEAIVFGNLLDPDSRVSQMKKQERNYSVLGFLDTRPRLTYLARIRNPNPKMPDFNEFPINLQEYMKTQGNPFESHHGAAAGGEHHEAAGHAAEKGAH